MKYIFLILILSLFSFAEEKYLVELKSGDIFIGTPVLQKYKFSTEYGLLDVDLKRIHRFEFNNPLKVTFKNNDKIEVKLNAKSFPLNCELGKIDIPLNKIRRILLLDDGVSDFNMKWSAKKAGLTCGISLDKKILKGGETLKVKVIVKNVSSKPVQLGHITFSKDPLRSNKDYNSVGLIMPYRQINHIKEVQIAQRVSQSPRLMPQAQLIFEFDVKGKRHESLKQMQMESESMDLRDVKNKLHFKQKLIYSVFEEGETTVQFRYQLNKETTILSPKIKLGLKR